MKRTIYLLMLMLTALTGSAQRTLTLDECRDLALRQNKTLLIGQERVNKSTFDRKAAGTNYLPKVSLTAGYLYTSQEISLLSDEQKSKLSGMGTSMAGGITQAMGDIVQRFPELAPLVTQAGQMLPGVASSINGVGQGIVDAFRTDTRQMMAGTILLTQPLYMGGKIRAYDRITHYAENIAGEQLRGARQEVILEVDQAYWQVVSLVNKHKLAVSYLDMLKQLDDDMQQMIAEGVATRAAGLTVNVKRGEAEMTLLKVEDGLTLARMLLCQVCGLSLDETVTLADESVDDLAAIPMPLLDEEDSTAMESRPEIRQLRNAVGIYEQKVKVQRSDFLPHLALMGGYMATYPSVLNGFERRFNGLWNVGVTLKVPVWNWGEGRYKVRSARTEANIARYNLDEAREKIQLQIHQARFQAMEAERRANVSEHNMESAEENLRTAQLGHTEGVVTTTDLLAAQTAWLQAHSDRIDAQIDIMITRSQLHKALGQLGE